MADEKHPLKRRWSLMHGKPASSEPREWRKAYTTIRTVATVEDLVLALAAMETPSELVGKVDGHTLLMFQEGATPDWKDPLVRNKGGRWDLSLRFTVSPWRWTLAASEIDVLSPASHSDGCQCCSHFRLQTEPNSTIVGAEEATQVPVVTDEVWSKTLLSVAGEALTHSEDVVGVAVEKKSDRSTDLRAGEAWLFRLSLWMQTASDLNFQTEVGHSLRDLLALPEESVAFCSFRREDRESNPKITI